MPLPRDLSPEMRKLVIGDPWGRVYPDRPNPPPPATDGRSACLRVLRRYLSEITFLRLGNKRPDGSRGEPIAFRVDAKDIHIGWPDYEKELSFPSIAFLHSQGSYETIGLSSYVEEDTKDVYGRGTVLQWMSEYQEDLIIEVWATSRAELRAILAGIEVALTPTELAYGLRLRVPEYFNQPVCLSIGTRQEFDEADSARNRRHARLTAEMRFTVVALVNYEIVRPSIHASYDADPDYNTPLVDEELDDGVSPPSGQCPPCG